MKYKIVWIETFDPKKWGNNWNQGHDNILATHPNPEIINIDDETGYMTVKCTDYFEANNSEQAKIMYDIGKNILFAIYEIKEQLVFEDKR